MQTTFVLSLPSRKAKPMASPFHAENMGNFIQERCELTQKRESTVEHDNVQSFLCS